MAYSSTSFVVLCYAGEYCLKKNQNAPRPSEHPPVSIGVCGVIPFNLDVRFVDAPAGVTQDEGHTGFLIHLPAVILALIFIARRIQPSLSHVDREVEFCVLRSRILCTHELIFLHMLGYIYRRIFIFCEEKSQFV